MTTWLPDVAAPANVWNVLYKSTNANQQAIAVSGTVLVPTAPWTGDGPRPIVAYATGTQGWGDQCAPSSEMAVGDYDEDFAVQNLLDQGWAVAVTDYPGLGTPGNELYAVNSAEGYAVLDVLKATLNLAPAGLSPDAPVAIEGYSQGGGAAAFAAQEAPTYAKSLGLVGVAMGGTPANLQAVATNLNGGAFFAFLGGAAIGFDAAYPQLHFGQYLTSAGKEAFKSLSGMCQEQGLATYAAQDDPGLHQGWDRSAHPPTHRAGPERERCRCSGACGPGAPVPRARRRGHPLRGRAVPPRHLVLPRRDFGPGLVPWGPCDDPGGSSGDRRPVDRRPVRRQGRAEQLLSRNRRGAGSLSST